MSFFRRRKPAGLTLQPEALIVGLGNPGAEYAGTRHNVGFELIDRLAKVHGVRIDVRKHRAVYGFGMIDGHPVALVKPLTYMNLSGQAVAAIMRSFGLKPGSVLVVADDMDLPIGRVRMKPKGGPGGHNGHRSIIASVGTQEYPRIRIGIGKEGEAVDHVLSRFTPHERDSIDAAIDRSIRGCELWLSEGVERAASWVNTI